MPRWFFSLQVRLVIGFAIVLALALAAVSAWSSFSAHREVVDLRVATNEALSARLHEALAAHYASKGGWTDVDGIAAQVSFVSGRDIVVVDKDGSVLADPKKRGSVELAKAKRAYISSEVLVDGRQVGVMFIGPQGFKPSFTLRRGPARPPAPERLWSIRFQEPPLARFSDTINRSLLISGIGAGALGVLLVALMSRRALRSVRRLTTAAQKLGRGDLSQRVPASGRDEIGELSRTFNVMAEGLQDAERQRRNMVADVAHELRNPLSNIRGYVEAVRDGVLEADEATIGSIHRQTMYLSKLVEDLRLLAETESADFRLHLEPASMGEVVARSVEAHRPQAQAKGVSLSSSAQTALQEVDMDRTRIEQVLGNLLQNAIRHTPSGGRVDVTVDASESVVRVTVSDTGEGISPDDLPHVFDRLFRADPSRARSTGGAGLGLTIAKQLVDAHGGSLRAESLPGQGSRFIFEIPRRYGPLRDS